MKRHEQQKMRKLYQQWLGSGQSKTVFATAQGIIPTTFYYWIKKFQKQELIPSSVVKNGGFSLLAVQDSFLFPNRPAVARINFPSGVSVDFYGALEAGFLKTLTE
jgi:hypothetical protein